MTKTLDKATPKLALACADGTHIGTVALEFCRAADGQKLKYMQYKLSNCIVSCCLVTQIGPGEETVEIQGLEQGCLIH